MAWIKGIRNASDQIEVPTKIKFTGALETSGLVDGADGTKTVKVTITNVQIKALRATNKTLVAAPGAGKFIEFISGRLFLDYGSNVLTESDDNLVVMYGGASGIAASQVVEATGFVDAAADTWTSILPKIDAITTTAQLVNIALTLDNNGDGELAGNAGADTVMYAYITYRVHTV